MKVLNLSSFTSALTRGRQKKWTVFLFIILRIIWELVLEPTVMGTYDGQVAVAGLSPLQRNVDLVSGRCLFGSVAGGLEFGSGCLRVLNDKLVDLSTDGVSLFRSSVALYLFLFCFPSEGRERWVLWFWVCRVHDAEGFTCRESDFGG